MSLFEKIKLEVEIEVDVDLLAKQFARLSDDAQAQFFCIAAKELGADAITNQSWFIGRHLVECTCSTDLGKEFLRSIVEAMDHHPPFCESESVVEAIKRG